MSFIIIFFSALLAGIVGGMGMGGGTVLIPALTVIAGVEQHVAQCANLISFLPMAAFSLSVHKKSGFLKTRGCAYIIIPAVITSVLGGILALSLPSSALRRLFGWFLIFLAVKLGAQSLIGRKRG